MSNITQTISNNCQAEMLEIFKTIHQHPELGFNETKTEQLVAEKLKSYGYEVTEGLGKTGIVAKLSNGDGKLTIGLRADMDALPIQEATDLAYKSDVANVSHMCGHDGHTTMLLGAAKYLAETKNFNGTLVLIFQPAEEIMGGAKAMIADGLFEKFPMDYVFGMHNMPGLEKGKIHVTAGAVLTAVNNLEITLKGSGGHGSAPEKTRDPIVAACALGMALQTIVSRNIAPQDKGVVTIGCIQAGDAPNVIPDTALLRLSCRSGDNDMRKLVMDKIRTITEGIATAYNVGFDIKELQEGAAVDNNLEQTEKVVEIAKQTFGEDKVIYPAPTFMASDDFAFFAQKVPGVYSFIGDGDIGTPLHTPTYEFDTEILPIGAAYWVAIAENYLAKA